MSIRLSSNLLLGLLLAVPATWWFFLATAVAVLLIGVGAVRLRLEMVRRRERELARLVEQRTRDLEREISKIEAGAIEVELVPFVLDTGLSGAKLAERLPWRILLVEDNAINQKVARLLLERMGYLADVAGSGREALEALERQRYDLVLMDVQMPEMDGLEATRRIRAEQPPERQPHIIALTANVLGAQREACLAAGMDDFLAKPITLADLRTALLRAGRLKTPTPFPPQPLPRISPRLDPQRLDSLRRLEQAAGKPLVREIVNSFLAQAPDRLARLRQAFLASDIQELVFVAHSLKGSSAQLGVVRVADLSARLEEKGKNAELSGAAALLTELEQEIEQVRPLLEEEAMRSPPPPPAA